MKALELIKALERYKLGDSHVPIDEVREAISELEALQQHIKSLEARLANTEQLTCDGCRHYRDCPWADTVKNLGCGIFTPKDAQ